MSSENINLKVILSVGYRCNAVDHAIDYFFRYDPQK